MGPGLFRLLLAILVVFHHSTPLRLGTFAVYVFFILSGYWIARMWDSKYSRTATPYWTFLVSRWWRLSPVFFACILMGFLSALALNNGFPQACTSWEWWIRQIPIIGSSSLGLVLAPSWSIDVEMQFYIAAPLLIIISNRWRAFGCWLLFAGSLVWFIATRHSGDSENLPCGWLYLPFFCTGTLLHRTEWNAGRNLAWGTLFVFAIITLVILACPPTRPCIWIVGAFDHNETLPASIQTGRWLYSFAGAFLMVPFISWNVRQRSGRLDREIGNFSYPLYLFHWIPREWYYHYVNWSLPAWRNGLLLTGNFVIAFVSAWLMLRLIDRPAERFREGWVNARLKKPDAVPPVLANAQPLNQNL